MNYKSQPYTFNLVSNGADAIYYRIDSSLGVAFIENEQQANTILTAHIYKGTEEIDAEGKFLYRWYLVDAEGYLTYTWYISTDGGSSYTKLGNGKSITVASSQIVENTKIYFEA